MSNIITCEQVSNGHPDKICDQIADAIVTDCLQNDRNSRVAIEVLIKDYSIVIAGELSSSHQPDYKALVAEVFQRIGVKRLGYDPVLFNIQILVSQQSPDIAQGVDVGGAGDQGMMFGYATDETPELMPMPFVLATKLLEKLKKEKGFLRADAKAQVSFDYDKWEINTFLCSVQHSEKTEQPEIHELVSKLMKDVASEFALNTDFKILVNPTGRFAIGGPFADSGVTGRKLACDTYGGVGHIGGGAMSGKDPTKVDRSGAYAARKIARDIVRAGFADKCEVQIAYAIGVAEPVSIHVECFGTEHQETGFIEDFIRGNYDLTPKGIIDSLGLLDVDYNAVSAYGHFGKSELPWEK
ncbi:MAG: methionine adenosyltransferase [Oscillospiraceae bacterium]|nr:methionine adenosyltransferase [Oscillospiraceae bacterium]